MKNVAIVGGGIVGTFVAHYLSHGANSNQFNVTMFDDGHGQATKAAAGIISPWLTKRRNQQWYRLARCGARLLSDLAKQLPFPNSVYRQTGTIITRNSRRRVDDLYQLALRRRAQAPTMGRIIRLSADEVQSALPLLSRSLPGVMVTGGAKISGSGLTKFLVHQAQKINLRVVKHRIQLVSPNKLNVNGHLEHFDWIVIATGAWIRQTLRPLGILADVRPQKGQLICLKINSKIPFSQLPVLMPEGEYDFLPFANGRLVIGSTHEDNHQFDLVPEPSASQKLLATAQHLINEITSNQIVETRTGTRGYTSDFGPFFGRVPHYRHLLVGGGLGSSGLTTGPIIGKFLAQIINHQLNINPADYEKPIQKYFRFEGPAK